VTVNSDITEDAPVDLTLTIEPTTFTITDTGYDLTIDSVPFIMNVNNQNPYRRETAQYRKDQFDNSAEPGEQSLTGWWLRSQTSWHNGAGINYYEPGTDVSHITHKFADSRGVDVWKLGEVSLLDDVFHSYTGANGIVAVAGNDGTNDVLVSGDNAGVLKKITLNGDSAATTSDFTLFATGVTHNSTYGFKSVTTDGSVYYAVCSTSIHKGSSTVSDTVIYHLGSSPITTKATIRYVKNYLMLGLGRTLYQLNPIKSALSQHTSNSDLPSTNILTHISNGWQWVDIVGGNRFIYAAGYNNSKSEIWAVPFDEDSVNLDLASSFVVTELPFGERVNAMYFYLGYLAVGTNKGIRIARVQSDGSIVLGPILVESKYDITGFVANDKYIWAATAVEGEDGNDNACLIRIDLSSEFEDGTFAYAYDLQYESDKDSYCTDVHYADDRLHMIVNEPEEEPAGEIQTQKLSQKRASGWLQTGKIRYGTIEPKYFRYINATVDTGTGDTVHIDIIDQNGNTLSLTDLTVGLSNQDILLENLYTKQEHIAFKFTLNNVESDTQYPYLYAYQVKSTPATRRQRLYQYPLSCYDIEMDRFGSVFGYKGRAIEVIQRLEAIEQTGRFVTVTDYRTNEIYQGVIEEVRFTNESSPDKNENGFGGMLLVTVRKM